MKIRFELTTAESKAIATATAEITGENIDFVKEENSQHKWGSASKNNGILEVEFKTEFVLDCIDSIKPFIDMVKGLIPAFKGLCKQAQDRMSKWTSGNLRELSPETAKNLWEKNGHDIVVVAGYSTHDWVEFKPGLRKLTEVGVHTPIFDRKRMEEILESDKDSKFYIFRSDGSFREATIIEAADKLL